MIWSMLENQTEESTYKSIQMEKDNFVSTSNLEKEIVNRKKSCIVTYYRNKACEKANAQYLY